MDEKKLERVYTDAPQWTKEIDTMRELLRSFDLAETIKWGKPAYMFENQNVVLIQPFKSYFALLFFKGGLLNDPKKLLIKMGEKTEVGRQMRFENVAEIKQHSTAIKDFIDQTIVLNASGVKMVKKAPTKVEIPNEFATVLTRDAKLKAAFEALTPGRQRGYNLHFGEPKKVETRLARIEKYKAKILAGKGLLDR